MSCDQQTQHQKMWLNLNFFTALQTVLSLLTHLDSVGYPAHLHTEYTHQLSFPSLSATTTLQLVVWGRKGHQMSPYCPGLCITCEECGVYSGELTPRLATWGFHLVLSPPLMCGIYYENSVQECRDPTATLYHLLWNLKLVYRWTVNRPV